MKSPKAPSVTPPSMPFPSLAAQFGRNSGAANTAPSSLSRAALPVGDVPAFSSLDRRRTSALSSKSTLGGVS